MSYLFLSVFLFPVRFVSLLSAVGTLNKGASETHSAFGPAQKLTFEDNFQQKKPISSSRHAPPLQSVPPFEDGFAVPLSAHFTPQTQHEKRTQIANSHLINTNQPLLRPYNCSGKRDGIYVEKDGTCAAAFWGCSQGKAFAYGCPRGLFYNTDNGKCDRPSEVVACGGRRPKASPENSPSSAVGTLAAALFDCSAKGDGLHALGHCVSAIFFACLGGRSVAMSVCSSGLKFDQQKGECAFADQCGKNGTKTSKTKRDSEGPNLEHGTSNYYLGKEYTRRISPEITFKCLHNQNGTFAKSTCARSFFKCTDGAASETNCTANLVYDAKRAQCTTQQICWQKSTNWTAQFQEKPPNPRVSYQQPQSQPMPPYPPAPSTVSNPPASAPLPMPTQPQSPAFPLPQAPSSVRFDCVGKSDGNFLHWPCQPTYLVCSNSAPVQMNCAATLVFDPTTAACENSDRCAKNNGLGVTHPSPPIPASANNQNGHFDCSAKPNGRYGQGHCRAEFVACLNGTAHPQKCQDGFVYDGTLDRCEHSQYCGQIGGTLPPQIWPPLAQKFSAPPPPTVAPPPRRPFISHRSFRCRGRVDGYYFKKPCAAHFYMCVAGHHTPLTCPGLLVFDPSRALCQYPQMCNYSANAPGKPTTPGALPPPIGPPQPPPPSTDFRCGDKRNGYYVRQPCTGHFYTCLGGKATKLACPGGLVFDMNSLSCQHAENCAVGNGNDRQENPWPPAVSGYPQNQRMVPQPSQFVRPSAQIPSKISNASAAQWQRAQHSDQLSSSPWSSTSTHSPPPLGSTSLPPEAKNGRRLPPRAAHQLLFSPSIDHSSSSGFCAVPRKSDGLYAVPNGCESYFFACTAGITTKMDCPLGLFYDAELRQCNYRENVASCGGLRKSKEKVPLSFRSDFGPNWANASSVHSSAPSPTNVSSPSFNCSDRSIGYYSGGCSSNYFSCTGLNTFAFSCPALLKFSELAGQCDYENNVPECGGTVPARPPPPVFTLPINQRQTNGHANANRTEQNPTKHPQHPANNPCGQLPNGTYGPKCSAYYMICSDGVPQDFLCQDEFVFHSPIGKCLPRRQIAECQLRGEN